VKEENKNPKTVAKEVKDIKENDVKKETQTEKLDLDAKIEKKSEKKEEVQ